MSEPTSSPRVGCVFRPQYAPERLGAAARAADASGLDEMWLWEDCFATGGISTAAIALANSDRMSVGVGVLPVPMRNVAITAMEIATLERAFPGRVRIGVGHGVQDWMRQIGVKVASPMTYLREYLVCLSALLRGETVTYTGRYVSLTDVQLEWPPTSNTELLAAATGPKTLELSGELATGTIISSGASPDGMRESLVHVNSGRARRSTPSPHSVAVYVVCATGPDAEAVAQHEVRQQDFEWSDDIAAFGTAAEIAAAARRWVAAGADTVVLQPPSDADTDVASFAAFLGSEVQPLLKD
ncbi:LLM class flavin-dependent oxidoreductase [Mycolicibacterium sp. P9-64]|uniref:LLM class flavin-dependent oxidoreductase n=1 Tax=Mycolicibacterium sp. P9-64 TaxID=2024612 RepID=UPI0011EF6D31|nr:LLM class flavin-dependent oxidoreductase [Mycolicibacterium sp. P9-64]KAA0081856.1 LLM class flavin-dependent oxidoreductase [Mycolicibacterium sp. P9-64]